MWESYLSGIGLAALGVLPVIIYIVVALIVRRLADENRLFSYPKEATCKAVLENGRLAYFIMAFRDHCFAGERNPDLTGFDRWDIVEGPVWRFSIPLLRGIRYIGLPPFHEIYVYKFAWASLEERQIGTQLVKEPVWHQEPIDYIFVRSDVYTTTLQMAICKDNIPLNSLLLIGARIVNPAKALFRVERWLEATTNVVDSRMRSFFGERTYAQLVTIKEAIEAGTPGGAEDINKFFKDVFAYIRDRWGVEISFVHIYSLDPASALANQFLEASTKKYVAEQQRDADIALGDGLAARDGKHFERLATIPGGQEFFKWEAIRESKLTTYVEGGGAIPAIPVGGQGSGH